jgi:uncharacterized membrane protein YqjE
MALGTQLRDLVDSFSELIAQHLALARVELAEDAKFIGVRVGVIAALAPLIFVGYGFLCVALAFALQRVIAVDLSFLLVGLLNLVIGGVGIAMAVKQLQSRPVMGETLTQLDATTTLIRREPGV